MSTVLVDNFSLNTALPLDDRFIKANTTARNAIPSGQRFDGLMVYTVADATLWQLQGGTDDTHWVKAGAGGNGVYPGDLAVSGNLKRSIAFNVTAFAGGGQASATALTKDVNRITTCATAGDSVQLPSISAIGVSPSIFIQNDGAASLNVFPATGEYINSLAVNTPISVPAGTNIVFYGVNTNTWKSVDKNSLGLGNVITALTGDVTASGPGTATATIMALPNSKLATMANNTVKGNISGSAATPSDVPASPIATASTIMLRDSNANVAVNNFNEAFATTVTAAGTTTLTVASAPLQQFTGTTTQSVVLPAANTLVTGVQFQIFNRSTGVVTVKDGSGATLQAMLGGTQLFLTCAASGSVAGAWDINYTSTSVLPIALGGTGQATKTAAFDGLSPNSIKGDITVFNGTNNVNQGVGTDTYVLTADSTQPNGIKWAAPTGSGGGGALNFISNYGAETGTTGYATYKDTAGAVPLSGTGGSPTHVTISASSTTPLTGTKSFLIANSGSTSAQGEGVSYSFTIDAAHKAKVLQISFDYLLSSGTFVAGSTGVDSDLTVWILDVTNNVVIQPSSYKLLSNSTAVPSQFNATFQTSSNSTSYRLIFHVGSTNTAAWTLQADSISVSPSTYVYGTPVTDLAAFTGSFGAGFGSITNNNVKQRRVGDCLVLTGTFDISSPTAAAPVITIPWSIDTNKINSTAFKHSFGRAWRNLGDGTTHSLTSGTSADVDIAVTYNGTSNQIQLVRSTGSATSGGTFVNDPASNMMGSNTIVLENIVIPILGWSSSVQTSDQTDTREVGGQLALLTNQSVAANSILKYDTVLNDTHGGYSSTTGLYTVAVPGTYRISIVGSVTTSANYYIKVDGVQSGYFCYVIAGQMSSSTLTIPKLKTGQTLGIYLDATSTANGNAAPNYYNRVSIERISGPVAIAATEEISARYTCTTTQALTSTAAVLLFNVKDYDSHGWYNISNGLYTVQTPGRYRITGKITIAAATLTTAQSLTLNAFKNGSAFSELCVVWGNGAGNSYRVSGSDTINCISGDTLALGAACSGSTTLLGATCQLTFERVK